MGTDKTNGMDANKKTSLMAVLFDMDGVLCTTDEYHYRTWKTVAEENAIPFSREDNHQMRGLTRRQSLEILTKDHSFSSAQLDRMLERKNALFIDAIQRMTPRDLLPGVPELLCSLSEIGILIGVVSSSQHVQPILRAVEILDRVQAYCDFSCTTRTKPAPDPYLKAAEMLGTQPSRCVVIEDSQAGIAAGVAAGMCVVGLGDEDRLGAAYQVASSMHNLSAKKLRAIHFRWLGE